MKSGYNKKVALYIYKNIKRLYTYWWRYPKAPTEKYIGTLENTNKTQVQTFSKTKKRKHWYSIIHRQVPK